LSDKIWSFSQFQKIYFAFLAECEKCVSSIGNPLKLAEIGVKESCQKKIKDFFA
jgi:hypothetical protein